MLAAKDRIQAGSWRKMTATIPGPDLGKTDPARVNNDTRQSQVDCGTMVLDNQGNRGEDVATHPEV